MAVLKLKRERKIISLPLQRGKLGQRLCPQNISMEAW